MTQNWLTWTDNVGCRVAAPVSDIACIVESPKSQDGRVFTGIRLPNAGVVSWLDAKFEDVLVEVFHSDVATIKCIRTNTPTDPLSIDEAVEKIKDLAGDDGEASKARVGF